MRQDRRKLALNSESKVIRGSRRNVLLSCKYGEIDFIEVATLTQRAGHQIVSSGSIPAPHIQPLTQTNKQTNKQS